MRNALLVTPIARHPLAASGEIRQTRPRSRRTSSGGVGFERSPIDTGTSEFDPANVDPDNRCEFGKWLHQTIDPASKASPDYVDIKSLHATFHKEAARILRLAVGGKKDEARTLLNGDYAKLSTQLVQKLSEWKRK